MHLHINHSIMQNPINSYILYKRGEISILKHISIQNWFHLLILSVAMPRICVQTPYKYLPPFGSGFVIGLKEVTWQVIKKWRKWLNYHSVIKSSDRSSFVSRWCHIRVRCQEWVIYSRIQCQKGNGRPRGTTEQSKMSSNSP